MPEKKTRPRTKACPVSTPRLCKSPLLHTVATEIIADESEFVPHYRPDSPCVVLKANVPDSVDLAYGETVAIDCGFSMQLPTGYKASINLTRSMLSKGLIATSPPFTKGRVEVMVTNIGNSGMKYQSRNELVGNILVPRPWVWA